jgi:hypothetical protein
MHIFRYGTLMRPPGPGAVPRKGLVSVSEPGNHVTTPTGRFAWGTADYDRELNPEEVVGYELEYITDYEMEEADEH